MVIERCAQEIPEKDTGIVGQHLKWYNMYISLASAQKAAIQRWRENNELLKANAAVEQEVQKQQAASKATKEALSNREQKQVTAQKIKEWKDHAAKNKEIEEEKKRMEENAKLIEQREKEAAKRALIKERLKHYKLQKEEEDRNKEPEPPKEPTPRVTTKDLAKFQEKDREVIVMKQRKLQQKDIEKIAQQERLDKLRTQVRVTAQRDPLRLIKATAASESRVEAEEEYKDKYVSVAFTGPFATRRAIPAWRQGL